MGSGLAPAAQMGMGLQFPSPCAQRSWYWAEPPCPGSPSHPGQGPHPSLSRVPTLPQLWSPPPHPGSPSLPWGLPRAVVVQGRAAPRCQHTPAITMPFLPAAGEGSAPQHWAGLCRLGPAL